VIITLAKNAESLKKYDLSCVKTIWTGAAPLGKETALMIEEQHPTWKVLQGYGLTETCTLVSSSTPHDQWLGSSGSLLPGMTARLVNLNGEEVTACDVPGELYIQSLSNALGYLRNAAATVESFPDGWMRTGDEAVFRRGPNGHEHLFIVDRIKELIKVKVSNGTFITV
jgi:long-subunit acyl-CoA synthetase (AMP-forming)